MEPDFAIVGAGRVGTALAVLLARAGYGFVGAASRSHGSAQAACEAVGRGEATTEPGEIVGLADLLFITTPDDAIRSTCRALAEIGALRRGCVVAHTSGAYSAELLAPLRSHRAAVGSLHPLQTFPTVDRAVEALPGSWCCIDGDPAAVEVLEHAATALDCRVMVIASEGKALYHAAAAVASNYLVTLEHAALKLDTAAGVEPRAAIESLLPLIKATVANIESVGIPQALTGPIARGDVETVRRHIEAIERKAPDLLGLYRLLGRETVEVAREKGTLCPERAEELLRLLD